MNFVLGDRILEINGHSLEGLSRQEVKYFENPQVDVEAYNSSIQMHLSVGGGSRVFFF